MLKKFQSNLTDLSLLLKINLLLTMSIFLLFTSLYNDYTNSSFIFTVLASISTAAILYLGFYIVLLPFLAIHRATFYVAAVILIITNLTLIVDFFIYRIWKFHINAMVLNIIFSPEAADSIQTGLAPVLTVIFVILALVLLEVYLTKKINKTEFSSKKKLNSKINKIALPFLLIFILSDKVLYGFANMYAKNIYLEPTKVVPLYLPMDFTGTMEDVFGLKGTPSDKQTLGINANKNIKYPLSPITTSKPNPTNIFIFAFDATRASIISEDISPNIYEFSQNSINFNNHVSGGNATRFGIFSLMYGLNGSYWFVFLNAQKGSILFDTLDSMNYQTHIFSATSTAWPEFTKTAYFDIQDKISDKHTGAPYQKDMQTTDEFLQWVDNADKSKPMFSFVFLDAPHGKSYPKENRKFTPDKAGKINYLTITKKDKEVLFNQYKNSVNFDDKLLKKMIDKLKENKLYENSIIIFTSDHGQEFYEYGTYGHNSSYNCEQVKVPFLVHLPENKHKIITKLTSHLDLVPTLMSYIGVDNPTGDYSNGYNLLDKNYNREQAYIANWNNNAILTDKYTYVFSNMPDQIFDNKIYNTKTYKEIKNQKTQKQKVIFEALKQNSKFIQ